MQSGKWKDLRALRSAKTADNAKLVMIGVHTPEFAFEHHVDNARRALQQMRVTYPIVFDNDYGVS